MTSVWDYGHLRKDQTFVAFYIVLLIVLFVAPISWASFSVDSKIDELKSPAPDFVHNLELSAKPFVIFFIVNYLEDNIQHILKTVFETRSPITIIAPFERSWKRLLKAKFPNIYCGKTHIECYNFYQ